MDKNGKEIYGSTVNNFRGRAYRRDDYDFEDGLKSYSSYDRYKNKEDFRNRRDTLTRSSFKTSLSSSSDAVPSYNRGYDRDRDRNSGGGFRRNDFNRGDRDSGFNNNSNNRNFTSSYNSNNNRQYEKPKETVDVSKLHPSWQAKKALEDKVKSLKFEGKKIKFNDD